MPRAGNSWPRATVCATCSSLWHNHAVRWWFWRVQLSGVRYVLPASWLNHHNACACETGWRAGFVELESLTSFARGTGIRKRDAYNWSSLLFTCKFLCTIFVCLTGFFFFGGGFGWFRVVVWGVLFVFMCVCLSYELMSWFFSPGKIVWALVIWWSSYTRDLYKLY